MSIKATYDYVKDDLEQAYKPEKTSSSKGKFAEFMAITHESITKDDVMDDEQSHRPH